MPRQEWGGIEPMGKIFLLTFLFYRTSRYFTLLIPKVIHKYTNVMTLFAIANQWKEEVQLKMRSSVRDSLVTFLKQQVIRMFAVVQISVFCTDCYLFTK
jgi:hypothetical protein